jgi:hypothetical protein
MTNRNFYEAIVLAVVQTKHKITTAKKLLVDF